MNYMSSETRPIKVTNLDSDKIRAKEIAIENSKTGKVTPVPVPMIGNSFVVEGKVYKW